MKVRHGFVTNSSSTSYIIVNISDEEKTLVDFVKENPRLVERYNRDYGWGDDCTQEELLQSAWANNVTFGPGDDLVLVFGDEDGTLIGRVFDYMLRDGGCSESFEWRYNESHR